MSNTTAREIPFWKQKSLSAMTRAEWESLCDGCGRCCLHKLEDEDTGHVATTRVACRLLDITACRCTRYAERKRLVPDCVTLDAVNVHHLSWMPDTCAYRLLAEGHDLPKWHPLVTGTPDSVHRAGISVRKIAISERDAGDLEDHIITLDADRTS
ncbi:MAG: YcgN family cysteine cluster protein [Sphingomonadales bacterium]